MRHANRIEFGYTVTGTVRHWARYGYLHAPRAACGTKIFNCQGTIVSRQIECKKCAAALKKFA